MNILICVRCERHTDTLYNDLCGECVEAECQHEETDHGVCCECGHQIDPGIAIDKAMDYMDMGR